MRPWSYLLVYNDVIAQVHLRLIWLQMHFMLSLQLPTAEINCSKSGYFSLQGERVQTSPFNIVLRDCCKVASFRQTSDISSMSQENVKDWKKCSRFEWSLRLQLSDLRPTITICNMTFLVFTRVRDGRAFKQVQWSWGFRKRNTQFY